MSTPRVLKTGHTVEPASEEDNKRLTKNSPTYDKLVRFNPEGWFYLSSFSDHIDLLYDFDFKPSDIIVMTSPKSGTTWMQEIVWNLIYNPNLDNPDANLSSDIRSPHIEGDAIMKPPNMPKLSKDSKILQILEKLAPDRINDPNYVTTLIEVVLKSPRVLKTHMPLSLFPPKMLETSKVVYVVRDPRDVIISKFNFYSALKFHDYQGTLDEFVESMINEEFFHHPYWTHVKVAFDLKDHKNLLFLYFEDIKADPLKTISRISQFLNLDRTPEQMSNVEKHTNFQNMKARTDAGQQDKPMSDGGKMYHENKSDFFRSGKSGNWKDSFTAEQVEKINNWMLKNMKQFPSDFKYASSI